ncbi:MAG: DUF4382 domain-containing protein [Deltaproteobacteria bacterium]|nr:DUF4382 domain-containing protein [Deltaproteobacteria bacterium]
MEWNATIGRTFRLVCLPLVLMALGGCQGSEEATGPAADEALQQGKLSVDLTDAISDDFKAVYVTVAEVQVNASAEAEAGWKTALKPSKTVNLLELRNGLRAGLGITELDAGHYSQLRLILGSQADSSVNMQGQAHAFANYVITADGAAHELKLASETQTGIKIVQGFDIAANETTELLLDFDAHASIVLAGKSGQYVLKPTVKAMESNQAAVVSGRVTSAADGQAIAGTRVSVQVQAEASLDLKDQIQIVASTTADAEGRFTMFLPAGTFNLVAVREGFATFAQKLTVEASATASVDIKLTAAASGTFSGTVALADASLELFQSISLRQVIIIEGTATVVEVTSIQMSDGGTFSVQAPAGEYQVVTSSSTEATQTTTITIQPEAPCLVTASIQGTVEQGGTERLNISF